MADLLKLIRNVPNFPKPGIQFKDITTLVKDAEGLKQASEEIANTFKNRGITKVVGVESRGYIFGSIIAYILNAGFILVRKPGKLPAETYSEEYNLEYGTDSLEIHKDSFDSGEKVLVFDDLLATGGTAKATVKLVEKAGGKVEGIAFIIELTGSLHGRESLKGYNIKSILKIPVKE
ncbi:MAG: adenine phosphoribosyltransferase [Promethearchaeota archaeon]